MIGAHPEVENFYFANGFSGHGIQQSPAVGNALAELIADGRFKTIDLSALGFERMLSKTPLKERNIV